MVLGAASLVERVAWTRSNNAPLPFPTPFLQSITDAWVKAYAPGNPQALLRRLSWDGLDPDAVRRGLTSADPDIPESAGAWTEWIDRYLAEGLQLGGELDVDGAVVPFVEILLPAWRAAARELESRVSAAAFARLTPAAHQQLGVQLLADLSAQSETVSYTHLRAHETV